jgi:hypothetical protein
MMARNDGTSGALVFNGVDGRTGRFLPVPATEREFTKRIRDESLGPAQLRNIRWWLQRYGSDDPNQAPA